MKTRPVFYTAASIPARLLITLFALGGLAACSDGSDRNSPGAVPEPEKSPYADYTLVELAAGDDLEVRAQEALINAQPGTVVQLPAGTYDFTGELSISVDGIVLRGTGMEVPGGTVLRFDQQRSGGQSISVSSNAFVIEDLAVENSPGDAIKVRGTNGATFRRVRVEWTNGPDTNNGAYGLYPVQTRNLLIEDNIVRGASDAGIYVGQSENIIVRRNFVYENVAGIEIENSSFADVYDNEATANTGGILVFELPSPPVTGGEQTRVFNNLVYDNNTPNFAREGNIVGTVPAGTGVMILATDEVEVFDNTITGNDSVAVAIVSYYIEDVGVNRLSYDPVPVKIFVHDNEISGNTGDPQDLAKTLAEFVFDGDAPDVFYDSSGINTDAGLRREYPNGLSEDQRICVVNNSAGTSIGQVNASVILAGLPYDPAISTDTDFFDCLHPPLPPVVLEEVTIEDSNDPTVDAEALCSAPGEGINADALVAACPKLSDYRLFAVATEPRRNANGGIPYDLTTPLFSDYTEKHRFVFVPPGSAAVYRPQSVFDFPIGTVISKTFAVREDLRDALSAEELIETRLLIRRRNGWVALPYIWMDDGSDALLSVAGGTREINWIDINGVPQNTRYEIPDSNNCADCHGGRKLIPIGPKARLLNKTYPYPSGTYNQIEHWSAQGILNGAPDALDRIVTIPGSGDTTAPLDERARGYLDINCAHCHSPAGTADTSGLFLGYFEEDDFEYGICKPPVAAGDGAGTLDYAIVPGDAEASIMVFRMASSEPDIRMPELGRSVVHEEGLQLVADWINAMEQDDCAP